MELRPGYKKTEVGIIPEEWDALSLSAICTMKSGEGITSASINDSGAFPVFGGNGLRGYTTRFTHEGDFALVGRQGALCGNVYGVSGRFYASEHAVVVTPLNGTSIQWLTRFLQRMELNQYSESSAQPGLSVKKILRLPVACPPVPEQKAIAEALSDVDASIAALSRLIAKKRDLRQGAMQRLLTGQTRLPGFLELWTTRLIGEFTDCSAGGTPNTKIASYWGGEIRWMSSGELHQGEVWDVVGRITKLGLEESAAKLVPPTCVLIGLAGQGKTRGTVAINMVELSTNQSIAAIFPNSTFSPKFLFYVLQSRYDELRELSSGDGGRGGLNLKLIKSIRIPFPSVGEQTAIARVLSDMDGEIAALETRLDKTRTLKQAMMQALLTGRVRLPVRRDAAPQMKEAAHA